MKRKTFEILATVLCSIGLSLVMVSIMLCPQSVYADQGEVSYTPCAEECFVIGEGGCIGRDINNCPGNGGNDGGNGLPPYICGQCRCVLTGTSPNKYCTCN